ncbi:MAG: LacI family DNA-binding transcriptional regulator, partial [Lachnospiraceae bacterium]|nr:LacI family DNA-binding transcriptional regulator [Lachnospiraceae bacterium]
MEEITIKDVAKLCGVGVSTVSRAINNHPDINPETKQMIMEVIKSHGYVPNNSARNLKRSDGRSIAILVKSISNPFFADMFKIFEVEV